VWIIVDTEQHFLPFAEFPWFKHERATIDAVLRVERPSNGICTGQTSMSTPRSTPSSTPSDIA
jgi:hypothetical protein